MHLLHQTRSGKAKVVILSIVLVVCVAGAGAYKWITAPGGAVDGGITDPEPIKVNPRKQLPTNDQMEELAKRQPVDFLECCLVKYDKIVKTGFRCTLQKQERLQGELKDQEVIDVHFREEPHSVYMRWLKNPGQAKRVVYVKGQNNDNMHVMPKRLGGLFLVERHVEGEDARASGRYTLKQFGLKLAMQRSYAAYSNAEKADALHVEYLGKRKVKEAGNRECWVIHRTKYAKPEEDGIGQSTLFFDTETWLQVGSILKTKDGKLLGEYFFRDIRLNLEFDKDLFTKDGLRKKWD